MSFFDNPETVKRVGASARSRVLKNIGTWDDCADALYYSIPRPFGVKRMKKKNVLLIGGGGFIGTALARCLSKKKFNVHILSRHYPLWKIAPGMTFHQGSLDDRELLERVLPECTTIIHLASSTTPGSSARQAEIEAKKNIAPTLAFLDILQNYKPFHLIFLSSGGTLYGNPESTPVDESHPLKTAFISRRRESRHRNIFKNFSHFTWKKHYYSTPF